MRSTCGRPRTRGSSSGARAGLVLLALALLGGGGEADPAPAEANLVPAEAAGATLDAVQRHYDEVRDFRADFVQTSFTAALGEETIAHGTVQMKRPGRMRWEYAPPDSRVILVDRESIRLYDPEARQLQIASLAEGRLSPTALDFLLGEGVLAEQFEASPAPPEARAELGLKLRPRGDQSFESIELWVHPESYQLRESVVVDLFKNRTSLRFEGVVENGGVPDAAFEFEPPEGTSVIDLR